MEDETRKAFEKAMKEILGVDRGDNIHDPHAGYYSDGLLYKFWQAAISSKSHTVTSSKSFEEWFVSKFANGKGTFYYSMMEAWQAASKQGAVPDAVWEGYVYDEHGMFTNSYRSFISKNVDARDDSKKLRITVEVIAAPDMSKGDKI